MENDLATGSSAEPSMVLPVRLRDKLAGFRRALLWATARDGVLRLALAVTFGFVALLIADRFFDTPSWIRAGLLMLIFVTALHAALRWARMGWLSRSPLEIAKFIRRQDHVFGDHLVGGIELAGSVTEQRRSASLCIAALGQVAEEAERHDFHQALPASSARPMLLAQAFSLVVIAITAAALPELVIRNADRLFAPFGETSRFTFVALPVLPDPHVVPRDEATSWTLELSPGSRWIPRSAWLKVGSRWVAAEVQSRTHSPPGDSVVRIAKKGGSQDVASSGAMDRVSTYTFDLPALFEPTWATLRVGDVTRRLKLQPRLRPELSHLTALVRLPKYLVSANAAGGREVGVLQSELTVVEGSEVRLRASASAPLKTASVDGQTVPVRGNAFSAAVAADAQVVRLDWVDTDGLRAAVPTEVTIRRLPDEPPTLLVESETIPPRVLDSHSLRFSIDAQDDFGVRRVGMQWSGDDGEGDRVLGTGSPQASLAAVFQASALSILPGEVVLRFWVEDDYPGRGRVYSDPVTMDVLSKDEHAVWMADQFARWRQAALDLRDRELSSLARNQELAETAASGRDDEWLAAVAEQARLEQLNAKQLKALTSEGESLLEQAVRNEEVSVDYVEKLAETIQTLEEMADQGMPGVADLLRQASEQEESQFAEMIDQESTQGNPTQPANPEQDGAGDSETSDPAGERIGLAGTTITDTSKRDPSTPAEEPAEDPLSVAVEDQTELVAEFDAVAEELEALLGNMEGSTLVKRLKSISRQQERVAVRLNREIEATFGRSQGTSNADDPVQADVADSVTRMRTVLDDLEAFCDRRDIDHFAAVLNEMKQARVLDRMKSLQRQVARRPGVSIAMAEYWADNLDRWADDLVDPGKKQPESGPQNNASLPPSIIVEVLRVLEGEVDLREQTRIAEQARRTMRPDDYGSEAIRLSESQDLLRDRLDQVVAKIESLPQGELNFAGEMEVLAAASAAMVDATKTLISPETGAPAIAAETEAIELLLRSRKIDSDGGGGSGGSAGGAAGGETDQAAMALIGRGLDEQAKRRESATIVNVGADRAEVPERLRDGVAKYFEALEETKLRPAEEGSR